MAAQWVNVEASGPVRTIRLRRPPINALDAWALEELGAAADAVAADAEGRVVVLASAIDGVFCSGGDLRFWRTFPKERAREVSMAGQAAFTRIARMGKATIAAIDGHVIGDGIGLALSCDLRLASPRTSFRLPEACYGFIPGWGTLHHLVRTVGHPRTLEMILTGRSVDANVALKWGLINRVQPAATFATGLEALLKALLAMSPTALSLAKIALTGGPGDPDAKATQQEDAFSRAWGSEDWREGISALLAKRSPRFAIDRTSMLGISMSPENTGGDSHVP